MRLLGAQLFRNSWVIAVDTPILVVGFGPHVFDFALVVPLLPFATAWYPFELGCDPHCGHALDRLPLGLAATRLLNEHLDAPSIFSLFENLHARGGSRCARAAARACIRATAPSPDCCCLLYAAADRPRCRFFLEETHHRLQRLEVIVSRGVSRQLRHKLRVYGEERLTIRHACTK